MTHTHHSQIEKLRHLRLVIGANIHARRLQHKMTLNKLSRLTGLNTNCLDMFEMGKDEINLHHMLTIATALNCRIKTLLE